MDPLAKAFSLMEQSKSDQAIQILQSYLETANEEETYAVSELYLEFGFIQHAQEIMQSLLKKDPSNSEYKIVLAHIYIELEEDDQAFHLLHTIEPDDPNYLQALVQLADLYQAQGLFEVAEQKLYEAKRYDPEEKIIDFALAELLFSIGKYTQCIDFYERVLDETDKIGQISIITRLAEAYAATGKYETAFNFFERVSDRDPDVLFKYGLTAFHLKRMDRAISVWSQLLEKDPYYYTVYYYLAKAYQEEEMGEEAYQTAKDGLQFDEHNDHLFYLTATLAYQHGEYTESETYVREAIKLNPDHRESNLFLIQLLTESDRYEEIVHWIEKLNQDHVYDPLFEWELARAYNELDEVNQAIFHYDEAFKSLQHDADFLQQYGLLLAEIGRQKDAIHALEKYLEYEPMDADILEYVDRLRDIFAE